MPGDIADAEEGLRLGVVAPEDTADRPCSAGVDGGGWGPGGLSDEDESPLEGPASDGRREVLDAPSLWLSLAVKGFVPPTESRRGEDPDGASAR